MSNEEERNHYHLKEMENIKSAKIVLVIWYQNVLSKMFTITEK